MVRVPLFAVAAALGFVLAGCASGMGDSSASLPNLGSDGVQTVSDRAALVAHRPTGSQNAGIAIDAANVLGSRVKDTADDGDGVRDGGKIRAASQGACIAGTEFFSPDRNGNPNSTEVLNFYNAGCTQLARDAVRSYAPNGSSESVSRVVSFYAPGVAAPIAVRNETSHISNATFGPNGFPIYSDGFSRVTAGQLTIANQKAIVSGSQLIMLRSQSNANDFCQDSAGYNAVGIPSLDESFGWQGGSLSTQPARRITSGNGSIVSWFSDQAGSAVEGPIGSLRIADGTPSTGCPIASPAFTLTGGTAKSSYSIPLSITYVHGLLWSVTIANATLSSGYTLNVNTTHAGLVATINGVVSSGSTQVATLHVNSFGNGVLTVTKTGAQYPIVDWNVVR